MKDKYKILVVDDEVEILKLIHRYLTMEGYLVETCSDAREALKKIEGGSFKILITDIVMPGMSGTELIKETKRFDGLIQVIAITGFVTMENILTAFRYGAINCLFKPFKSLDVLKEEVEQAAGKLERIRAVLIERMHIK